MKYVGKKVCFVNIIYVWFYKKVFSSNISSGLCYTFYGISAPTEINLFDPPPHQFLHFTINVLPFPSTHAMAPYTAIFGLLHTHYTAHAHTRIHTRYIAHNIFYSILYNASRSLRSHVVLYTYSPDTVAL